AQDHVGYELGKLMNDLELAGRDAGGESDAISLELILFIDDVQRVVVDEEYFQVIDLRVQSGSPRARQDAAVCPTQTSRQSYTIRGSMCGASRGAIGRGTRYVACRSRKHRPGPK